MPIKEQEFKSFSPQAQYLITQAFYRRCGHPPSTAQEMMQTEQYKLGLKRIDCLLGRNKFCGVVLSHVESSEGGDVHVLKLNVAEVNRDGGHSRSHRSTPSFGSSSG
jgi:hypothetical protein